MLNKVLWFFALLLIAAAIGLAVYKVWPLLNPPMLYVAAIDSACDLRQGPCASRLPDGAIARFSIEPRDIPVVRPLRLEVAVEGLDVSEVEVDFSGVDMNMGFNRPVLEPVAPGRFAGQAMLPVCVRARMTWEAKLLLKTPRGLIGVPYRFDTFQPDLLR